MIAAITLAILPQDVVLAGDGVIDINEAKAEAGDVTAGDAEGFPVTIDEPGSYRLTGNLTVPDENTTAILILADHVTVDLNGFSIIGPNTCTVTSGSPTAASCSSNGSEKASPATTLDSLPRTLPCSTGP